MSSTNILVFILAGIDLIVGLLLLTGKVKLVINYSEEEQPAPWPERDEEESDNYVKPLEVVKPPTLVEAPKRKRGGHGK